jgi:hypothetical protein
MSAMGSIVGTSDGVQNHYTWAFWRELGSKGIMDHRFRKALEEVFGHPVTRTWTLTGCQPYPTSLFVFPKGATKSTFLPWISMILSNLVGW